MPKVQLKERNNNERVAKLKNAFKRYLGSFNSKETNEEQRNLIDRLNQILDDTYIEPALKLHKFKTQIVAYKPIIENSVDSPFIHFMKNVLNILTFSLLKESIFTKTTRDTASSNEAYNEISDTLKEPALDNSNLDAEIEHLKAKLANKLQRLEEIKKNAHETRENSRDKGKEEHLLNLLKQKENISNCHVEVCSGSDVGVSIYIQHSAFNELSTLFSPFVTDNTLTIKMNHDMYGNERIDLNFSFNSFEQVCEGLELSTAHDLSKHNAKFTMKC
ncbi:MAG: hypothetical protein PSV35_01485 [bacterium]|nr:hypothetical protein [bacterium]